MTIGLRPLVTWLKSSLLHTRKATVYYYCLTDESVSDEKRYNQSYCASLHTFFCSRSAPIEC
jgi:lipopolysaccharide biosynthesis glycosyltransferase